MLPKPTSSVSQRRNTCTKDAREYDEDHRRAVRSGNAVERTRAKLTEEANRIRSSATTGQTLLELKESLQSTLLHGMGSTLLQEGTQEHLIQHGIRWKSKPTAALHFGRVWERLVRSCKKAMYAVLGNRSNREDLLSATMCTVEQILNTRTLTPVNSDVNEFEALTPNRFLLGNKNVCLPYLPCAEEFFDHPKLFRQTQTYANLMGEIL